MSDTQNINPNRGSNGRRAERRRLALAIALSCVFATIAVITAVYQISSGFRCVFLALSGLPCPGCGLTRAWLSLFSGSLTEAFTYHPLFFAPPLMALTAIPALLSKRRKILYFTIFAAVAAAMLITWAVRLMLGWRG